MAFYEYSGVYFSYDVCDIISVVYISTTVSGRDNKRILCFVHTCGFHFVI